MRRVAQADDGRIEGLRTVVLLRRCGGWWVVTSAGRQQEIQNSEPVQRGQARPYLYPPWGLLRYPYFRRDDLTHPARVTTKLTVTT